jgi:heme exporter protein A
LEHLAGRRGEKLLFEGLSLTLGPGAIAELRGPNGAGTTTLLLIVAGVLVPLWTIWLGASIGRGSQPAAEPA